MAAFSALERYKLTGVRVLEDRYSELGRGSYASILQLEHMGLKCAGKKLHQQLLRRGDDSYHVRRFEEECLIHSQVRHPNIVQFLGVYFQAGVRAPILVMEFLPTNLTSCIEQYDILPKEINYSILYDVALALCYLHSQTPPIIHRDLSSNNVLLTPNMTAKISDFGKGKYLSAGAPKMTRNPGTIDFMPPEAFMANAVYDTCIDEFSYGIMMIHVFSGKWPAPQIGPTYIKPDGTIVAVTEADRRKALLDGIGKDHPLMGLILKCIHNHPQSRAHASEIVDQLAEMVKEFPVFFANRLEMQRLIELQCCAEHEQEKKAIGEKLQTKDKEIRKLQAEIKSLSKVRYE